VHESGKGTPSNKKINEVVNGSRNSIKHMDDDGEQKVTIDPISEAKWHIDNALISLRVTRF
jgi:hypothetical protein